MSATQPQTGRLAAELASIAVFGGLSPEDLNWLAAQMTETRLNPGDVAFREGEPADRLFVVLEGELRMRLESSPGERTVFTSRAGQVTGMLPFSRMKQAPATAQASQPTRLASFPAARFPEMLERMPALGARLVGVMSDRIRESTRLNQQRDKLAALGKLSAGLAHELNNPAAAARRAAATLREAIAAWRQAEARLDSLGLSTAEKRALQAAEESTRSASAPAEIPDSLERSDREQAIADWLEERGVAEPWDLAGGLVDASFDLGALEGLAGRLPETALADAVKWLAASSSVGRLLEEIDSTMVRIGEMVRAIKEYSYMDQGPMQEVDVHQGIESTLVMLRYRLKHGVTVVREFDRSLPRICASGSELNIVWTNLIENAIDAMGGQGELRIRTAREPDRLLVEISDSGPGIPEGIRDHVFEPFFTTKNVGEGTGLGLDAVYRTVTHHGGEVSFESDTHGTRFQVRLPFAAPKGEHT